MILVSQWYKSDDESRSDELREARRRNETSGLFRLTEYVDVPAGERLTFGQMMARFNYLLPDQGEVCVIANTDIVFDETARLLPFACRPGRLVALTRWETPRSPRMLGHYVGGNFFSGSQDVWAFVYGGLNKPSVKITLGDVGCDQAIVGWAASCGCEVTSPSLEIKTWHLHADESRPPRSHSVGTYGYPELTTLESRGLVMLHEWPPKQGETSTEIRVESTCRQ